MSISYSLHFGLLTRTASTAAVQAQNPTSPTSSEFVVRVYPRWYRYVAVDWTVPAEWGDCVFNVYFSQTEQGNYRRINNSPVQGNSLVDWTSQEYSEFRDGWYVVEALLSGTGATSKRSLPATWRSQQGRWVEIRSNEIQRREHLLLRKFTGVKSYLFKRKTYGQRCRTCWDERSETVTKDNCGTCYGTSFEGGYWPPQPLYVQFDATPNQVQRSAAGRIEPSVIGAWTISMPGIASQDLVMRVGDWNVYQVVSVQTTELQANPVRQILQLSQLSRRDVENQLATQRITEFPTEFRDVPGPGPAPQTNYTV